ncbi:unnamed protein product, partial [Rotaria magnacalcarata]
NIYSHLSTAIILLFVCYFGLCYGELYSVMVVGVVDKWLRIKLGATYNYLIMFCI